MLLLWFILPVSATSLKHNNECVFTQLGSSYTGTISMTTSGKTCQRWDSQTPHHHGYNNSHLFPDLSLDAAANYCRNPSGDHSMGPWCFTTHENITWEYCQIPECDCKQTMMGYEYMGKTNITQSGVSCQRWDSQYPQSHPHTNPNMFSENSVSEAENYCRNPNRAKPEGPWCYTTNPDIYWEYCHVEFCECKQEKDGLEYQGQIAKTTSGKTCQRWDSQSPHSHTYTQNSLYPEGSISAAENYCRNPDDTEPNGPWCYTTDKDIHWEYCDVPLCVETGCKIFMTGLIYNGNISTTVSGRTCQRWDEQSPHQHTHTELENFRNPTTHYNFCRNPDVYRPYGPWCYTTDPKVRWEYCNIPFCECILTDSGEEYGGRLSKTMSGLTCQRWDSQVPHHHRHDDICAFPDHDLGNAANFCRNPDPGRKPLGPWCYTTDVSVEWEYCNVSECNSNFKILPQYDMEEEQTGGLSVGALAGLVVTVVLVLALVSLVVLWKLSLPTRAVLSSGILSDKNKCDGKGYDNPIFAAIAYNKDDQPSEVEIPDYTL